MRIVAGKYRSRKLESLEGEATRPTADRVRESLFNILASRVEGAYVLDLFSGSGALALEAVSRGAEYAVLNDKSPKAFKIIEKNVDTLKAQEQTGVMCQDAHNAIDMLADSGMKFSLIFLDPPYDSGLYAPVIEHIRARGILETNGIIICEHRKGSTFDIPSHIGK